MKGSHRARNTAGCLVLLWAALLSFVASASGAEGGFPKSKGATGLEAGKKIYEKACSRCHDRGISGAPKIGDRNAWEARIAQGMEVLVKHAVEGYMCNRGVIPPRGGDPSLSDSEVAAATAYLVGKSR